MDRPNIFKIATSELSQDALITWLLKWADSEYSPVDRKLHSCAVKFVRSLIRETEDYDIKNVKAGRQWNNIDVWAKVNDDYFIVIEDKKGTKEHSGQLKKYAERAKKHYENENINIVLVYFKMEPQGNYSNIKGAGFSIFTREEMLSILKQYYEDTDNDNKNDILTDYYFYLKELDEKIKSFETTEKWGWYAWKGFFETIQKEIGGEWDYVPNPSGGFLGLWWNWNYKNLDGKEFQFYLQLEYGKLIFKLYVYKYEYRRELRDYYRRKLFTVAKADGIKDKIHKYGRIGQYMGVAKLKDDYRVKNENGLIDIASTIENLRKMKRFISLVASEIEK